MQTENSHVIRKAISDILIDRGQPTEFDDAESLFDSGKLDSLAAVHLLMTLESKFGIDLSDPDFEIDQIDSCAAIVALVETKAVA